MSETLSASPAPPTPWTKEKFLGEMRVLGEHWQAFVDIGRERRMQDSQWGGPDHDDIHTHDDWLGLIADHTVRADSGPEYRSRLVKVAALAVAAIETHDRRANQRTRRRK